MLAGRGAGFKPNFQENPPNDPTEVAHWGSYYLSRKLVSKKAGEARSCSHRHWLWTTPVLSGGTPVRFFILVKLRTGQGDNCYNSFATPWTVACQAPLYMELSRQEYWSGEPFPSSRGLPYPGIELMSPALQADSLLRSHQNFNIEI